MTQMNRTERMRYERLVEEQRLARRRQRRNYAIACGLAAVMVVAVVLVWGVPALRGPGGSGQAPLATQSADAPAVPNPGVQSFEMAERSHVQGPVSYPQTPPVGGNHAGIWQNCGFYDAPIVKENGVHSLEHGALWITYRPDLPSAQIDALRQIARGQTFILVTPWPDLPAPVVASVWDRQLQVREPGDPELSEFIRMYRVGPTTPEPGAPCTGGFGQPR